MRTLKSCDVFEGGPFALECQVSGRPTPSVSWYKENVNIDNSPDYVITKINGTCTLRSKHSRSEHGGRYSCVAVNTAGEASSTARVNVIRKHCSQSHADVFQSLPCLLPPPTCFVTTPTCLPACLPTPQYLYQRHWLVLYSGSCCGWFQLIVSFLRWLACTTRFTLLSQYESVCCVEGQWLLRVSTASLLF